MHNRLRRLLLAEKAPFALALILAAMAWVIGELSSSFSDARAVTYKRKSRKLASDHIFEIENINSKVTHRNLKIKVFVPGSNTEPFIPQENEITSDTVMMGYSDRVGKYVTASRLFEIKDLPPLCRFTIQTKTENTVETAIAIDPAEMDESILFQERNWFHWIARHQLGILAVTFFCLIGLVFYYLDLVTRSGEKSN